MLSCKEHKAACQEQDYTESEHYYYLQIELTSTKYLAKVNTCSLSTWPKWETPFLINVSVTLLLWQTFLWSALVTLISSSSTHKPCGYMKSLLTILKLQNKSKYFIRFLLFHGYKLCLKLFKIFLKQLGLLLLTVFYVFFFFSFLSFSQTFTSVKIELTRVFSLNKNCIIVLCTLK